MLAASMTRFVAFAVVSSLVTANSVPVFAAAPAPAGTLAPSLAGDHKVDFERHLVGLFGRMGCNSGSCHGSFQGRGGLRLSLFGYDPEKDYQALTRDNFGRRIDP